MPVAERHGPMVESDEYARGVAPFENAIAQSDPVLVTAIESARTLETNRLIFNLVKIVHVMEGSADIATEHGTYHLTPGMSLALGSGQWFRVRPAPHVRVWTLYVDEHYLRSQMTWFLPSRERTRFGVHPTEWSEEPLLLHLGMAVLKRVEPLWRKMSVLRADTLAPEAAALRRAQLFARALEQALPALLASTSDHLLPASAVTPVRGRFTSVAAVGHVGRAIRVLREEIARAWTARELAAAVSVSRTHLTRLFGKETGLGPMQFLTELRLTEFVRLIEETDRSIASAAIEVGWNDARVASKWFRRRYGVTPMQFRRTPHPHRGNAGNSS